MARLASLIWVGVSVLLGVVYASARDQTGMAESNWQALKAASASWPMPRGALLAHFEADGAQGVGRFSVGFDSATRSWFRAGHSQVTGVNEAGQFFQGEPRRESIEPSQTEIKVPIGNALSTVFPRHLVLYVLESPKQVEWVRRDAEGNWHVRYRHPLFASDEERFAVLQISEQGLPLRAVWEAHSPLAPSESSVEFRIDGRSPEGFEIASEEGPYRLVDVSHHPGGNPNLFTIASIESLAVDNRIAVENSARARLLERTPELENRQDIPYESQTVATRASWPLIVTGIVVVGIGIFALIRTRIAR